MDMGERMRVRERDRQQQLCIQIRLVCSVYEYRNTRFRALNTLTSVACTMCVSDGIFVFFFFVFSLSVESVCDSTQSLWLDVYCRRCKCLCIHYAHGRNTCTEVCLSYMKIHLFFVRSSSVKCEYPTITFQIDYLIAIRRERCYYFNWKKTLKSKVELWLWRLGAVALSLADTMMSVCAIVTRVHGMAWHMHSSQIAATIDLYSKNNNRRLFAVPIRLHCSDLRHLRDTHTHT